MKKLLIISALFSALLVWSPLQNIFPFSWLYLGFSYLSIFFHELGHAVIGFFMSFNLIDLCWKLIHDDAFQDQYF